MSHVDHEDDDRDAEVAFSSQDSETSSDSSSVRSDDEPDVERPLKHRELGEHTICPFVLTSDGFVICTICKIGIVPHPDSVSSQRAHVKKKHRGNAFSVQQLDAKSVSEIQALYDDSLTERPSFERFPVLPGFKCCVCGVVSSSVRKMRSHLSKSHGDMQTSVHCHAEKVFVQVFECINFILILTSHSLLKATFQMGKCCSWVIFSEGICCYNSGRGDTRWSITTASFPICIAVTILGGSIRWYTPNRSSCLSVQMGKVSFGVITYR